MDQSDISRLRSLPIKSVAERLGLRVSRHKCLCPFHDDKHPSLSFSVSKNSFKCFVCDAHGGVIDLAMQVLDKNFIETCRWLADSSNIGTYAGDLRSCQSGTEVHREPKPFDAARYAKYFERPFINQSAGEFLFEKRRLDPRVVRWCRLTSWRDRQGTDWLQIPYFNPEGILTGIQWRNLNYTPTTLNTNHSTLTAPPRFRFPYGSQCHIYNLPVLRLLKEGEPLYVAEGCSDCWSLLSSGHKAIAIPSATIWKPKELEVLNGLNLHIYPDQDIPGEKLFLQLKQQFPSITRHSLPPSCKDYSDYYLTHNPYHDHHHLSQIHQPPLH